MLFFTNNSKRLPPEKISEDLLCKIIHNEVVYSPFIISKEGNCEDWFLYVNFERFGSYLYVPNQGINQLRIGENNSLVYSLTQPNRKSDSGFNCENIKTQVPLEKIKVLLKFPKFD